MTFARASSATAAASRVLARPTRLPGARASSRTWWSQRTTAISRRRYATAGGAEHEAPKPSSDIPWLVGAIAVTVPGAYFLLQPGEETPHGHGHGQEQEAEKAEEHKQEVEQPTSTKVEAKAEQAAVTAQPDEEGGEAEAEAKSEAQGESEQKSEEEQKPEEEQTPEEAGGPGTHPVVPDTAKQSPEAPSKKADE